MDAAQYARIVQGPAVVQPLTPVVAVTPSRGINPLIPLCCIGFILFLIAATIIVALIPVYLARTTYTANNQLNYNVLYRINSGTLPFGSLTSDNCQVVQADERAYAASNRNTARVTPTVISCTVSGNGNTAINGRRRRQTVPEGNQFQVNGVLHSTGFCLSGNCLSKLGNTFIQALLNRGIFYLTLAGANGTRFAFSISIISASLTPSSPTAAALNDIAILNYALVLERLEASFYTLYQANFTAQDFINANFAQQDYDYFNVIQQHELAHVSALIAIITQLGGTPVPACTYIFSAVTDVQSYVALASTLEATGAMAYDGAVNGISSASLRQAAATIATVEARHSAYLHGLNGESPAPNAFETALQPTTIIAAIQQFIVSCPFTITAPTVPYIGSSSYTGTVPTSNIANGSGVYTQVQYNNDIAALNYALILEQLENYYYNQYVDTFSQQESASGTAPYFMLIRAHEIAHVNILRTLINNRQAVPVANCSYNFPVTTYNDFVALSRTFENTGTSAYDGAINTVTDPGLILLLATIATIEARHAAVLNGILGMSPFPNVTEPTIAPATVVTMLSTYQTCPFTPVLPVVLSS